MPRRDPDQRKGKKNKPKLDGADALEKLQDLSSMRYEHQAKWVLNAYWAKAPVHFGKKNDLREKIFAHFQAFAKLDPDGNKGCDLHQHKAHQFLEKCETGAITFLDLKAKMKELDSDHNLRLSLAEYLVHEYKLDVKYLTSVVANVDASHQAKLDACAAKLAAADDAMQEAEAAKAESLRLLAEIKAFKDALKAQKAKLQAIIDDEAVSNVKRMKAKHELNDVVSGARAKRKGIKGKDPDFLRKAMIDQKAAVRRQKKAAKKCAAALAEASAEFEKLSAIKGVASQGTMWWMGRELEEMKKYCSQAEYARKQKAHAKKKKAHKASLGAAAGAGKPRRLSAGTA